MEMLHEPEFWVAVGFVLVIALLVWKGVPGMVAKILDQRADYQKRAASAEAEAHSIVAAATAEAEQFQKDCRIALEAQIARRAAAAQDKIAQAEASALNEIRALAADSAVNAAQNLIAARLDDSRASSLIAESIKGVGEKLN